MTCLTIGHLMLGVAGLAVVLAAGRVHLLLGEAVLIWLTTTTARTTRWVRVEQASGRFVGWFEVACDFGASLWITAPPVFVLFGPLALLAIPIFRDPNPIDNHPTELLTLRILAAVVPALWFLRPRAGRDRPSTPRPCTTEDQP